MGELPKDPIMLMSVINMKLRDFYPSMDALCDDLDLDRNYIDTTLASAGYVYNEEQNRYQ